MANSNFLLELRFILDTVEEAEIVKNTLNPEFYKYQETRRHVKKDFVSVVFYCCLFDFSEYVNVRTALNKTYVAFIIEKAIV